MNGLIAAGTLYLSAPAMAAEPLTFTVYCQFQGHGVGDLCHENVKDVVTETFIKKYPSSKYHLWVLSTHTVFSDGSVMAYARAGVMQKDKMEVPRYARQSFRYRNGANDPLLVASEDELHVARSAVQDLMEQCAMREDCDIYRPHAIQE